MTAAGKIALTAPADKFSIYAMFGPCRKKTRSADVDRRKRLTSSAYNRWARVWNFARYTNGAIYDTALRLLDERHKRILDVGCGTGLMSEKLAASGRHVCGVDLSAAMIRRAQRKSGPRLDFILGDAEKLPSENASFDAVVNLISFHHYPNPARAAAEFRRVLRPGGRLVLVAFDGDSRYIRLTQATNRWAKSIAGNSWQKSSAQIATLLRSAGFTRIEVSPVRYWVKTFAILAE
jgi:ubiquinone/menaquinone biosynthesis C-methylase UbiE